MFPTSRIWEVCQTYELLEDFVDTLLFDCPFCGFETVISESLTRLSCSNPRCPSKIIQRIKAILKQIGVKGLGESGIADFVDTHDVSSPVEILNASAYTLIGSAVPSSVGESIKAQISEFIESRPLSPAEILQLCQIPNVSTQRSKALMEGYATVEDAMKDFTEYGPSLVDDRLRPSANDNCITASSVLIYDSLMSFSDDILLAASLVHQLDASKVIEATVVVSDAPGEPFKNKPDFYDACRERLPQYHFTFASSLSRKNTDALIWAGADGSHARYTSKVRSAEKYNASGGTIPILTGEQFITALEDGKNLDDLFVYASELNSNAVEEEFVYPDSVGLS